MNRASGTCGIVTKGVTFLSFQSHKERRKNVELKIYIYIQRKKWLGTAQIWQKKKRHKHTDSRTEQTPTSISISKSMSRHIINKLMATKDKEKNRKDNQRELRGLGTYLMAMYMWGVIVMALEMI